MFVARELLKAKLNLFLLRVRFLSSKYIYITLSPILQSLDYFQSSLQICINYIIYIINCINYHYISYTLLSKGLQLATLIHLCSAIYTYALRFTHIDLPHKNNTNDKNKVSKQLPFFELEIAELIRIRLPHFAKSFQIIYQQN